MGAGVAELFMPLIDEGIMDHNRVSYFQAWRWCMFIPGCMMLVFPILFMLFATDLPNGNYRELLATGQLVINTGARATGWEGVWVVAKMFALLACLFFRECVVTQNDGYE